MIFLKLVTYEEVLFKYPIGRKLAVFPVRWAKK